MSTFFHSGREGGRNMFKEEDKAAYSRARVAYYLATASEMRAKAQNGRSEAARSVFFHLEASWLRLAEAAEHRALESKRKTVETARNSTDEGRQEIRPLKQGQCDDGQA